MENELLEDLKEEQKEDDSVTNSPLMSLAQIEEDDEDVEGAEEARKLIRRAPDSNTIELVSP